MPSADEIDWDSLTEEERQYLDRAPYQKIGDALAVRWRRLERRERGGPVTDCLGLAAIASALLGWISGGTAFWYGPWYDRLLYSVAHSNVSVPLAVGVWLWRRHRGVGWVGRALFGFVALWTTANLFFFGWIVWLVARHDPESPIRNVEGIGYETLVALSTIVVPVGLVIWLWPSRPRAPASDSGGDPVADGGGRAGGGAVGRIEGGIDGGPDASGGGRIADPVE